MGPVFLTQPFLFQAGAHLVRTLTQNSESVWISTDSPALIAYLIASLMAVPSMRILVVFSSLPIATGRHWSSSWSLGWFSISSMTAQPPGPGLGSALPSVHKIFITLLYHLCGIIIYRIINNLRKTADTAPLFVLNRIAVLYLMFSSGKDNFYGNN